MAGDTRMISCSQQEFNWMFGGDTRYEFVRWDTPIQVYTPGTSLCALLSPANGGPTLQAKIDNPRICFKKGVSYTVRELNSMGCQIFGATTCSGDYFIGD